MVVVPVGILNTVADPRSVADTKYFAHSVLGTVQPLIISLACRTGAVSAERAAIHLDLLVSVQAAHVNRAADVPELLVLTRRDRLEVYHKVSPLVQPWAGSAAASASRSVSWSGPATAPALRSIRSIVRPLTATAATTVSLPPPGPGSYRQRAGRRSFGHTGPVPVHPVPMVVSPPAPGERSQTCTRTAERSDSVLVGRSVGT